MRRAVVASVFLAVCLLACTASFWLLRERTVQQFVLPDAKDVSVESRGVGGLTITYRAGNQPGAWRGDVARQLAGGGWHNRDYSFGFTQRFIVTWYTRTFEIGPVSILESAIVGGDPDDPYAVRVQIHRELHFADSQS